MINDNMNKVSPVRAGNFAGANTEKLYDLLNQNTL